MSLYYVYAFEEFPITLRQKGIAKAFIIFIDSYWKAADEISIILKLWKSRFSSEFMSYLHADNKT